MNRLQTMSRFAEPDEPKVASVCVGCDAELYEGDYVVVWEGEHFCNLDCLSSSLDVTYKTLGED